jgi:hypothetical protein
MNNYNYDIAGGKGFKISKFHVGSDKRESVIINSLLEKN